MVDWVYIVFYFITMIFNKIICALITGWVVQHIPPVCLYRLSLDLYYIVLVLLFAVIQCQEYSAERSSQCPEQHGEQTYPHPDYCDQFYLCTNGTLTLEQCGNGLLYDGKGAAYHFCNYHWAVDCGNRKAERRSHAIKIKKKKHLPTKTESTLHEGVRILDGDPWEWTWLADRKSKTEYDRPN